MSAKWRRSQKWDDDHIPRALWPVKFVLRALSSIWLAVTLLVFVALYGVLASVPIGIIVKAPTYALYFAMIVLLVGLVAGIPAVVVARGMRKHGRVIRFVFSFAVFLGLGATSLWIWSKQIWPHLRYDPGTGRGLMFFSKFVSEYGSTTLRRLPGIEMSELEFYAWWPLRVVLLLFVLNLVVATVRRIEFNLPRLGVLMVHSGIVTIALGSIYYNGLKLEGDTILLAGRADEQTGDATIGRPQQVFYDNTRVSLYVDQFKGWEQRHLEGVPRYNDYNLGAVSGDSALKTGRRAAPWDVESLPPLSIPVMGGTLGRVDDDIRFRIVGYASYAEAVADWVRVDASRITALGSGTKINPVRFLSMLSKLPDKATGTIPEKPVWSFTFLPADPAGRWQGTGVFSIEYTLGPGRGMSEERWRDLQEPVPAGTQHALVVEVPANGLTPAFRGVYPIRGGEDLTIGATGYRIAVKELAPEPPFPIITDGYRGSTSSLAIMTITPPPSTPGGAFERWVYHRFPEISQDLLQEKNERGMPRRRNADPSIRVSLIECDQAHVYFDEPREGVTRVLVRSPGGGVRVEDNLRDDMLEDMVPKISLRVSARWDHAIKVDRPAPVAESNRDKSFVGTHDKAMLAVEVSVHGASGGSDRDGDQASGKHWNQIVWLPFTKYMGLGMGTERSVDLPDGRKINLAFGRRAHQLPGFTIQLVDFKMIAYDHRGSPRDYQSLLRVTPVDHAKFEAFEHVTQLNAPLRAPFHWDESRAWVLNMFNSLRAGLSPMQFKFSQAGWDRQGWVESQKLVDEGKLKKPRVGFTILGVGNNPGIHIIAAGAVMMGVGIPWAFYIKPILIRREKRKIQEQLASGTYRKPEPAKEERELMEVQS